MHLVRRRGPRFGVTLVEVLIAIGMIAMLTVLLIPAIQRIRESANVAQCQSNLRQIGIGILGHHDNLKRFPSGGWGWSWIGMPDRGSARDQPGGWLYNVLPNVEQDSLRKLGAGLTQGLIEDSILELLETPVATFNCPSRRSGGPFAYSGAPFLLGTVDGRTTSVIPTLVARADYAGNAGSQTFSEIDAGPHSLTQGDNPAYEWADSSGVTGIFFLRSNLSLVDVSRGASSTIMVGERYISSLHYIDGNDRGDNEMMYVGFDNDVNRVTCVRPMRDSVVENTNGFGSAHATGVNMLFCDGSVRVIGYDVDPNVFLLSGQRHD